MKYSDQQRIEKMRETTEKLLRYVEKENITPEIIFAEEAVQWTVTTPLYNIGEHAANLSEDFKKQYPDIPWVKIAGLRHRLVHHYEDTNWTVICAIIFDVLPDFEYPLVFVDRFKFINYLLCFFRVLRIL